MPGTCSKFALGKVVRTRPAMLRLAAELVSSGTCKHVTINTATHAALVAAVEKKFRIRCCRLLCVDGVDEMEIEDDSDLAELREDDQILVYEKDAAGLAGVTDGDARLANRSEMISLLQVAPLEMHALGCAFQNYFRPKGPACRALLDAGPFGVEKSST